MNEYGDVVIGFNASGAGDGQFVGSYAVSGETINGETVFDPPESLRAGEDTHEPFVPDPLNPWGHYSSTVIDPDNPFVFWTAQEVALAHTAATPEGNWGVQITEWPAPGNLIQFE